MTDFVPKVIFVEFSICAVFFSEPINYTTEKEKRLKTDKNAFSRLNKKDRQRRGEASGLNQLKPKSYDVAKIQPFIGCRKAKERKDLFFYFSFFS